MSSIRPLATITVLAGVGVFLYMKINETEPIMPAEISEYNIDEIGEIQFGDPATMSNEAPTYDVVPSAGDAPAFDASPSVAPNFQTGAAPAFNPGNPAVASTTPLVNPAPTQDVIQESQFPVAETPQSVTTGNPSAVGATDAAATSNVPDLPPLPALPPQTTSPGTDAPGSVAQDSNTPATVDTSTAQTTPQAVTDESSASGAPSANDAAQAQQSLFAATRLAVQAALDRGELSQALLLLSDWYGDPSLTASETQEVNQLLSQLAGSVIYSTEHRLEPPYMVQEGERLEEIAKKYKVPWQLLAKINGITQADQLQPGQQLKVLRGPFSAVVDLSQGRITIMLDRRYAGQFAIEVDPTSSVEEGHWSVNQKLLTPANTALTGTSPTTPTEDRSLMLTNTTGTASQLAIIRAGTAATSGATEPTGRVIRLASADVEEVYDILSLGSAVVIRR